MMEKEMKVLKQCGEIVDRFRHGLRHSKLRSVKLAKSRLATWRGVPGILEMFLPEKFERFSDVVHHTLPKSQALQALMHFSYVCSKGQFLIADFQGCKTKDRYIISDLLIIRKGHQHWNEVYHGFKHHKCNDTCHYLKINGVF
jgi:hypothetical protein